MATKKTTANTEAKKTVKRTTKTAEKKTTTRSKKAEEKKPEIIDVEDFREVTEEEAKVDPAEAVSPPEDEPEVEEPKITVNLSDPEPEEFNIQEVVRNLMNKYKVDVNDQNGIEALENTMTSIISNLHEKAGMDEKTSQIIATNAMESILSGINSAFKAERRIKAKADRLAAKEEKLNKKIQLTREERQNLLYGSSNTFGAPGIYTIASNLPNQIQVQVGGEE